MDTKEIKADQLENYCTTLGHRLMKDHEKRFANKVRALKEASSGLSNAGARLTLGVKNSWGTMDKQAGEYAMRLAQTIQENSQNLSRRETGSSYQDVENFHRDAVKALNDIILTVRKYVPKLRRMLRPEMAAVNSSLMRLERSIVELGAALDASPGNQLESLERDVQSLQERKSEFLALASEERAEQISLEENSTREKELQSQMQDLLGAQEFLELAKYEEMLKRREDEMRQLVQPLAKPLLKLERLAAAKQTQAIDNNALRHLVESPVEAVAPGQRFASMQLLDLLEENLGQGRLEILERKRRKAEEAIGAIRQGALDKDREEYLSLQANVQETKRQLKSKGLSGKRDDLIQQLSHISDQKTTVATHLREFQRRRDDLEKTISKLKTSMESQINKVSHESVTISTD